MQVGNPFVIITGLSGSGKDTVLKAFEDMGYFCVDNLPLELIPKFAELCNQARAQIKRAAIVIDVREGDELARFPAAVREPEEDVPVHHPGLSGGHFRLPDPSLQRDPPAASAQGRRAHCLRPGRGATSFGSA